jgi:hypothetical protein
MWFVIPALAILAGMGTIVARTWQRRKPKPQESPLDQRGEGDSKP